MAASKTARIPVKFYVDHMDRSLPTPPDLTDADNYVTVSLEDPHIWSLLGDAEYYASQNGPDLVSRGLVQSAKRTAEAIRKAMNADGRIVRDNNTRANRNAK